MSSMYGVYSSFSRFVKFPSTDTLVPGGEYAELSDSCGLICTDNLSFTRPIFAYIPVRL
jgi:hypothetical protein